MKTFVLKYLCFCILAAVIAVTAKSGHSHKFTWQSNNHEKYQDAAVSVELPISRRRFGMAMEIEAKMPVNDLLESTGRRLMLFGRLIGEYSGAVMWNPKEDSDIFEIKDRKKTRELRATTHS